jgi:hypothetical protein
MIFAFTLPLRSLWALCETSSKKREDFHTVITVGTEEEGNIEDLLVCVLNDFCLYFTSEIFVGSV